MKMLRVGALKKLVTHIIKPRRLSRSGISGVGGLALGQAHTIIMGAALGRPLSSIRALQLLLIAPLQL